MQNSQKDFYKKLLGLNGEKLAIKTLKKNGYKILLTNYVTPFGEADIVAEKDNSVIFVEVKTRSNDKFGTPAEAVNYKKQKKYRDIANYYFLSNEEKSFSFVVVEVVGDYVNVITDAF